MAATKTIGGLLLGGNMLSAGRLSFLTECVQEMMQHGWRLKNGSWGYHQSNDGPAKPTIPTNAST